MSSTDPYIELTSTLSYIGENFTNKSTPYLGNIDRAAIDSKRESNEYNFVEVILKGYDKFKEKYSNSLPSSSSITLNQIQTRVMKRTLAQNSFEAVNNTTNLPNDIELNFSKLIISNPTSVNDLLTELNNIRKAYSFLHDTTLTKYMSGRPFTVSQYSIDNTNKNTVEINASNKSSFVTSIEPIIGSLTNFDFVANDIYVIRRLLLFYELMANIYISMYLYEISVSGDSTLRTTTLKLTEATGNILLKLNNNVIFSSDDNSTTSQLTKDLNNKVLSVRKSSDKINALNDTVRELKYTLSLNDKTYDNRYAKSTKTKLYQNILLSIFIISIVVILAVSFSPIDKSTKLITNGIVLGILIITAIIIDYMYRKNIEGFEDGSAAPGGVSDANNASITQEITTNINNKNNTYRLYGLDFLTITIYTAMILQSNKAYTNMNASMKREIKYFTQMSDLVENTGNKISYATSLTNLDILNTASRMTFFVSLGIIIGATCMAYVMTSDQLKYQPYIIGIAGLLILLVTAKYIYDISKRVRNDPSKFYWRKPNDISKLD